jgi:hypothetical protein
VWLFSESAFVLERRHLTLVERYVLEFPEERFHFLENRGAGGKAMRRESCQRAAGPAVFRGEAVAESFPCLRNSTRLESKRFRYLFSRNARPPRRWSVII